MGTAIKSYDITGNLGAAIVEALFDTGAEVSLIRKDIAERIGTLAETPGPYDLIQADGNSMLTANHIVNLKIEIGDLTPFFNFYVVDELPEEMIIGVDFMRMWRVGVHPEQEDISIKPRLPYLRA